MSGQEILGNPIVMRSVGKYLNLGDLESLQQVADVPQTVIDIRKECEINLYLGVDPMPLLSSNTRVVNIHLIGGVCDGDLAWRQLRRIRELELNLSVSQFTDEALLAFETCEVSIRELTISSMALWGLQTPLKLGSIEKLVIDELMDIYMPGLLRLIGNNRPTEMIIPADYLDYPEIRPIIQLVTKLQLTGPRKHTMGNSRVRKLMKNMRMTLTHIELTVPLLADTFLHSKHQFPGIKYFSVTTDVPKLDMLASTFPALETLELRNSRLLNYCNTDGLYSNLKNLRFVLGEKTIKMNTVDRLDELFPKLETIEVCGDFYDSRSLDAVFRKIGAEKVIIEGRIFSYNLFCTTKWLKAISGTCKELKIIPIVSDGQKIHWSLCAEYLKKMANLESLHIKNFQQVTRLNIKRFLVEDSLLQQDFFWPGTCVNCSFHSII